MHITDIFLIITGIYGNLYNIYAFRALANQNGGCILKSIVSGCARLIRGKGTMKMKKVFIDGSAGTTGLRIYERLTERGDIQLISLSDEERKDVQARKQALNACDIAFLCLPDDAARGSVSLIENPDVVVLDTSTAHRTAPGWVYGFPEISPEQFGKIKSAKRIAVPGCHASGFVALIAPLVKEGVLKKNAHMAVTSVTGYSGGGKKMIGEYEDEGRSPLYKAPRLYALGQQHKHLKEMMAVTGIENAPAFMPLSSDFYSGMEVIIPLFAGDLADGKTIEDVKSVYAALYTGDIVKYRLSLDAGGYISAMTLSNKDSMHICVEGNEERMTLIAVFNNLGKGASGAAIECMNIVLGLDPAAGLDI